METSLDQWIELFIWNLTRVLHSKSFKYLYVFFKLIYVNNNVFHMEVTYVILPKGKEVNKWSDALTCAGLVYKRCIKRGVKNALAIQLPVLAIYTPLCEHSFFRLSLRGVPLSGVPRPVFSTKPISNVATPLLFATHGKNILNSGNNCRFTV